MDEALLSHSCKTTPEIPCGGCPLNKHRCGGAASKYAVEDWITSVAFISVFALLLLPYKKIDGNPVPTVIFNDLPAYFHAFVLGLNFAFCGGVMTISLRQLYPTAARACRCACVLSMLLSASIFLALAVPWAADAWL